MNLSQVLSESAIVVRVDQAFKDMLDNFNYSFRYEYEDISEVPEQTRVIAHILTPTDSDYRGDGQHADAEYSNVPEIAALVGLQSKRVYIQELLNDPQTVVAISRMTEQKFVALLQAHIVASPTPNDGARH